MHIKCLDLLTLKNVITGKERGLHFIENCSNGSFWILKLNLVKFAHLIQKLVLLK